ncbi:HupE/UreJ family protein [Nocardioides sp. GY 10127]|uniref:HupE/UreJ family protein n=1 Tax=Nocardioides sp. GY 10127 TaxID=2569762 RepID=UPI0010A8CC91|nr:HupE/UreJ family protein [Nocardioides sp. GY 10127]TIC85623.1 HupE/UreJ family protein [Nocardioides sp. GY 10127]
MVRRAARACAGLVVALVATAVLVLTSATSASAHVVPTSTIELAVTDSDVVATVEIPLSDLESATGLDLGDETQADVDANADAIEEYLLEHFQPTTDDGEEWTVSGGDLTVVSAGTSTTTGIYAALETTFTLTPPADTDAEEAEQSFDLGFDAIVDKVATHTIIVTVESDSTDDDFSGAYEVGTIKRDTVTNTIEELHVDLSSGTSASAFTDMVQLGMQHIQEGVDHQLFLLTLLLPAPLLALRRARAPGREAGRRWAGRVDGRTALRRIGATTLAFTLGHSITLALGAYGLPVHESWVEAAIALSILVAAVHAVRPLFPGREALVAGSFGLVHGLAFSEVLRSLDLTGLHLVLALLGFNLGIELMQLVVVAAVLPALVMLSRLERVYAVVRLAAASLTGVAACGWLLARVGYANPVSDVADWLGEWSLPVLVVLWAGALAALVVDVRAGRRSAGSDSGSGSAPASASADVEEPAGV